MCVYINQQHLKNWRCKDDLSCIPLPLRFSLVLQDKAVRFGEPHIHLRPPPSPPPPPPEYKGCPVRGHADIVPWTASFSARTVKNKHSGRQLSRTVKRMEDVWYAVTRILYLGPHHSLRTVKNKQEGRKLSRTVKRMQDVQCAVTRILYLGPHHSLRTIKNKQEGRKHLAL